MEMQDMPDYEANAVLSTQQYKVVGKRPVRHDGADKVTGKARFGADMNLPGMLYGRILRSPHAHARILRIDTSRVEADPRVKAVVTAADFSDPGPLPGAFAMLNLMAREKVLYKGHAVAAVAAASAHDAEEALSLIDVEYEVLPAVFDAEDAMAEGAPRLHEDLQRLMDPDSSGLETWQPNVAKYFELDLGDVEAGFAQAEVIAESSTRTLAVHQGYIEPHAGTAQWHEDDRLTVWSSGQGHFSVREATAKVCGVAVSRVRVVPLEIGGGFGAKLRAYVEPVAALLARRAQRAVKIAMTRTEVFEATGPTSGTQITVKVGATRDGRLTAASAHLVYEAGGFPGSSVMGGARCVFSPYDIPNALIEGWDVVVNRPKTSAYRAPGTPPASFAMETALDRLAEQLQMDPIELRLKNTAREGTRRISGAPLPEVGFQQVLEAARDHHHRHTPLGGPWRGRGVASGYWGNGSGPSCAVAVLNADGTVHLAEGSPDIGGSRTAVAQQFAEIMGMPIEDVRPTVADTDSIGQTSNTGGSGVAFKTGHAAVAAARDMIRQLTERAAAIWECDASLVRFEAGVLAHAQDTELRMTLTDVAARAPQTGGAIVGRAGVNPSGAGPTLATHIVDVEVDPDTGKVTVLRYTAVQDAGKAIHPSYVEGQIQGAVAQGIGWALSEEYFINDDGVMENASFLDYRMPTSLDLPMIDTVIVEVANPGHPFGVRGVGEVPIVPPLAAMANAIYDAIGVRLTELPMNPPAVLDAILQREVRDAAGG
jgi:CO/xanthine dehydrogenase Mo-binding subunit